MPCAPTSPAERRLWLFERVAAAALGYDFAGVLVESAGLRNGLRGLFDLGIGEQQDLEAFLLAERGHEDFLFDFALDPIEIFGDVRLGVTHIFRGEVVAEGLHHRVVHLKIFGDGRFGAQELAGESADAGLRREQNVVAEELGLELIQLGSGDDYVRGNAAAAGDLAPAVRRVSPR